MIATSHKPTKQLCIYVSLFFTLIFFDVSNLDSYVFRLICGLISSLGFHASCPDYYDLPIWEFGVTIGTLSAAYYAYAGIKEPNKRLEIEQSPHVVLKGHITTAGTNRTLHVISLKNIGKGSAINIRATSDPIGKISIIDGTNPHSIDLDSGESNTGWAIDEQRVIEGLVEQGKIVSHIINDIPDENELLNEYKEQADFYLYLWYEDQLGSKYRTQTTFRHSGHFIKVMKNVIKKI